MKVTVTYEIPVEVIEELVNAAKQILDKNTDYDEATNYILDLLDITIGEEFNYHHYDDVTVSTIQDLLYERCEHKCKKNDNKVNEQEKLYHTLKTIFGEEDTWR